MNFPPKDLLSVKASVGQWGFCVLNPFLGCTEAENMIKYVA